MWDIATHPNTGDWLFTGTRDLAQVRGADVIQQEIRHRLKIARGWILDQSGYLGSRIEENMRLPRSRFVNELPLMIADALEPMETVTISEVEVEEVGLDAIRVRIDYQHSAPSIVTAAQIRAAESLVLEVTF